MAYTPENKSEDLGGKSKVGISPGLQKGGIRSIGFDDRGRIMISPLGTTMMAGPEALMRQETLFLKGFQSVREMTLSGGALRAVSGKEGTVLVFGAGQP